MKLTESHTTRQNRNELNKVFALTVVSVNRQRDISSVRYAVIKNVYAEKIKDGRLV